MLFPFNWFQKTIYSRPSADKQRQRVKEESEPHTCLAPFTHLLWSNSQKTGGLAGATARFPVCPTTLHFRGCMYILGSPQPSGTHPH
jgi:hypothetical protein